MAERLLNVGWRPTDQCRALPELPSDANELYAIRLMPPMSNDYFIEFLNIPAEEQELPKVWIPVKVNGAFYGLPSFKFMGVLEWFRRRSSEGLEYAAPEMMSLANLLSHPAVTDVDIKSGEFLGVRRCAKDLGRVIAIAHLSGRGETEAWAGRWREGLEKSFPQTWRAHARRAGAGLREMLADDGVMEQARMTTESGLLSGMGIGVVALRGVGERLLVDAIEPLERGADE